MTGPTLSPHVGLKIFFMPLSTLSSGRNIEMSQRQKKKNGKIFLARAFECGGLSGVQGNDCRSIQGLHLQDEDEVLYRDEEEPLFMIDDVLAQYEVYWSGSAAKDTLERAKKNRASGSGSGTKHTTGSISIAGHQTRMKPSRTLTRSVSFQGWKLISLKPTTSSLTLDSPCPRCRPP